MREYRRELAAAVDEAIDAIRAAIDRAEEDRRHDAQHTRARLDALAQVQQRCEQLGARLDGLLSVDQSEPTSEDA